MYYRLSRRFSFTPRSPTDGIPMTPALWSLMTARRRLPPPHPVCMTPGTDPTEKNRADVASLLLRQRKRVVCCLFWQLLFCRLFNESAYRHLDLQFSNLTTCRNPTSPDEEMIAMGL